MRFPRILLRRVLPACAILAVAGLLAMRGCPEEPQASASLAPAAPTRAKERADPQADIAKWSQRFAEKKAPPSEVVPDATTTPGQLDNSLRFILSPQADEPGEVSLRLIVLVGSMHETKEERGLAHFVEHLAFMGRRSRPEGHTLEEFQRLGLTAGADSNAHTARDHTLYQVDLPLADEAALEKAFQFLRDVADGLLFRPEDVESERRVILRELDERQKDEASTLRAIAILPKVPAAGLSPGGLKEVVEQATPSQLRSFWQKNYLSSRMALSVVGDFEMEAMNARLHRHFDSLPKREAPPAADPGDPLDPHRLEVRLVPHPADDEIAITIAAPWPLETQPYSPAIRRRDLVQSIALEMLAARLSRDAARRKGGSSQAKKGHEYLLRWVGWSEFKFSTSPDSAAAVLESLFGNFLSARDGGFTERECAEAKGEQASLVRTDFMKRLSKSNPSQAELLADSFRTCTIVESPEDELNRALSEIASISRAECEAALRRDWRDEILRILISGSVVDAMQQPADEALARALAAPRTGPKSQNGVKPLFIESFGTPGVVSRQQLDEARGFLEAEFSNGVLVRLQPMPALGGMVAVEVGLGHGLMSVPADRPGLGFASALLMNWYPLEGYDQLDFQASLAESGLSSSYSPGPDSFRWGGVAERGALGRLFQVLCARIEHPGLASMSKKWVSGRHERSILEARQKLVGSFRRDLDGLLAGSDARQDLYAPDLMKCDSDQVAEWLLPMLKSERLCVLIAGDFEPQQALKQLAATFGALPQRQAWDSPSPYPALVQTPPGRRVCKQDPDLKAAAVAAALPCEPPRDAGDERLGILLRRLVEIRMKALLRDQQGESYSTSVYCDASPDRLRDWLVLRAYSDSERSETVAEALRGLMGGIQRGEWSSDEFLRASRPVEPWFRKYRRSPWAVLHLLRRPERLPAPLDLEPAKLVPLEPAVRKLARQVLDPEAAFELRSEPAE